MDFEFLTQSPSQQSFIARLDHDALDCLIGALCASHNRHVEMMTLARDDDVRDEIKAEIDRLSDMLNTINPQILGIRPGEYRLAETPDWEALRARLNR
jgi:hypothetical protein